MRFGWIDRIVAALAITFFSIFLFWWLIAWGHHGNGAPPVFDLAKGTLTIFVPLWIFLRIVALVLFGARRV